MAENPSQAPMRIEYPAALPISAHVEEIRELWRKHPVIVIGGATGSGKTTQLPKIAAELGWGARGMIGCTQPRRIAATAMARRVAAETGGECGGAVGYQVRFDEQLSEQTCIKFMTDGILLAETRSDRQLRRYSCIIIDEAHERSLNIDFLLGYLKELLLKRKDLKIAISSATLDLELFSRFFDNAPVVEVEGRTFPVEDHYLPPLDADEELDEHLARAVEHLSAIDPRGDILAFLPGEREIRECTALLTGRKLPNTEILPLFARLSNADQQKVFRTGGRRRIILATNVAETSITIPGIRFCIDSGLARISRYNPRNRIQELRVETISKASIRQRRGRCGRTSEGICVHMYSEDDFHRCDDYTDPEIRRSSLAGVILQMAALHLPRIDRFQFIDPPPPALIREGMRTLEDLGAIHPGAGTLTADGRVLSRLPIDPQLGKMMLEGRKRNVLREIIIITAFLSIADPRERPMEKQKAADDAHRKYKDERSDFVMVLKLFYALKTALGENFSNGLLRRYTKENYLNFNRMREWLNLVSELIDHARELSWRLDPEEPDPERIAYDPLHIAILSGIPRQIAKYVPEYQYFLGTGGRKFVIFPGSGLARRKKMPAWLLSFALMETSRLFGRQNAEIRPEFLMEAAPHLCHSVCEAPAWDERNGFVYAREKLTSGGLVIHPGRRVLYSLTHPAEAREIFLRAALVTGILRIPGWPERHSDRVRKLEAYEERMRRPGTLYDPEAVYEHFALLLPSEINSAEAVKKLVRSDRSDYAPSLRDMIQEDARETFRESDYPDHFLFSGHRFKLQYRFDPGENEDGVTILCPEEELNLLPEWALDWHVPGLLAEKADLYLRSLPKHIRRMLSPLAGRAARFADACRDGKVFPEQPLTAALCDFLLEDAELELSPKDFPDPDLPEYLTLKLAVLNKKRQITAIHRMMPDRTAAGSKLSGNVKGVSRFERTGCDDWPEDCILPQTAELPGVSGKTAYPALTDEGESIGVHLYLRQAEAEVRHREGLVRLFLLRNADQARFIRRGLRFSREMLLGWFLEDREKRYTDDLLHAAVLESFPCDPESIRDREAYLMAEMEARADFGETAMRLQKQLDQLLALCSDVQTAMEPLKRRSGAALPDLKKQYKFLFAPGFLRRPAVWNGYARFLKALRLRAERMDSNPLKDREKAAQIEEWEEKFYLACETVSDLLQAPELYEFWLLLEESRIAVFAPEMPLKIKSPVNKLENAWKELRF